MCFLEILKLLLFGVGGLNIEQPFAAMAPRELLVTIEAETLSARSSISAGVSLLKTSAGVELEESGKAGVGAAMGRSGRLGRPGVVAVLVTILRCSKEIAKSIAASKVAGFSIST